ncbi:MAG: SsrA-binding protein SmpB [Cryomorphaceae bacterium]|nr:SsrA-binding protein SmpB [Cryomorphaceae bacterium]
MANTTVKNRRARYDYEFLDTFVAGLQLYGTEIKAIREGKAALNDSYCLFLGDELFIRGMYIGEYSHGNINNHETYRDRKLLLQRRELEKLTTKMKNVGNTIVPVKLFINERGLAKLEIALAKGKKTYDKRDSIKEKDVKREMDRRTKF